MAGINSKSESRADIGPKFLCYLLDDGSIPGKIKNQARVLRALLTLMSESSNLSSEFLECYQFSVDILVEAIRNEAPEIWNTFFACSPFEIQTVERQA